jgi:hypothetical protein
MSNRLLTKVARGFGWALVVFVGVLLGTAVAFLPLMLLPGPIQLDLVHRQWVVMAGMVYTVAVLSRRLTQVDEQRFSPTAAARFLWLAVSGFALVFWPLVLGLWFNGYNTSVKASHDMLVTGMASTSARPGGSRIESFTLRDPKTGWTANMEVTEARKQFAKPGQCVRIAVNSGRLGLDWISDAKPIPCPQSTS